MKILGFIPARGGSKSIPLKNLYNINNKPLIYYTLKNAIDSKIFYKIIVSSDNNKILDYSILYFSCIFFYIFISR
jgi:N-acylneuraminate cytidylyltransferase